MNGDTDLSLTGNGRVFNSLTLLEREWMQCSASLFFASSGMAVFTDANASVVFALRHGKYDYCQFTQRAKNGNL
ncbi:hypothetical protein PSAB6_150059 [Paraburkholderia sabiae]|nr:hypothetical protein PSAB6_150059 [Paraburkholderia sabiae]